MRAIKDAQARRAALIELLNVPDIDLHSDQDDPRGAHAFLLAERFVKTHATVKGKAEMSEGEVFTYARLLRQMWIDASKGQFRDAEAALDDIFRRDPLKESMPAFTIDGTRIAPKPRTLLQGLALELLTARKTIRRCAACKDFFFPERGNSRQKFCRHPLRDCQHEYRNKYMKALMKKKRSSKEE